MKSLKKLYALKSGQRTILFQAGVLLCVTRIWLWARGLQRTRRFLRRIEPLFSLPAQVTVQQITAMVVCAARRCPLGSTCLTRALTAHLLLGRSGYESRLCIGVARGEQGNFESHAWLESNQQVILGGTEEDVNRYLPFDRVDELTV